MPRTVEINWGDGSPVETWTGDKGSKDHKFAKPGNYQITVTPTDGGAPRTLGVAVPCSGTAVTAAVACDNYNDATGRTVKLTVTGATGPVSVNWGDGGYPETITGPTATHTYSATTTGPVTIAVTHSGTPVAVTGSPITIPCSAQATRVTAQPSVCVRPLVTGVQVSGTHVTASVSHPEGVRDTVVVVYRDGNPVAQSSPLGKGGSGTTAPIGPLTPGSYIAKACEVGANGAPSSCCEAGTGTAFTISAR